MALFEVPGWTVPSTVPLPGTVSGSRKRKRPTDNEDKLHSAEVNVDKLISKLVSNSDTAEKHTKKKKTQKVRGKGKHEASGTAVNPGIPKGKQSESWGNDEGEQGASVLSAVNHTGVRPEKRQKNRRKTSQKPEQTKDATGSVSQHAPQVHSSVDVPEGLTELQASMRHKLDGARFRWINEQLYKSDSEYAHQMMRENPAVFSEYHTGFRHQVQSWPSNPVSYYINTLSAYPSKTVIADLGCGDATLARALVPKGLIVLSFDLVSDNEFVIEADMCAKLPLPGSDEGEEFDSDVSGQVVDIVVCALSLMGTNWPRCIREAWRVLRLGGELKIAEVTSRFTEIETFTSLVSAIGFKLQSKDESNTHFTLFEFRKIQRKRKSEKEWSKILSHGELLKPCEYKRR